MKFKTQSKSGHKLIHLNRRKAIRERCLNCAGWHSKGVFSCQVIECPLYKFRSGMGKQNSKSRNKAIRKFCFWCMAGKRSEVKKCSSPDCPLFAYRNSKIDRSIEITAALKKSRIEDNFKAKIGNSYLSIRE